MLGHQADDLSQPAVAQPLPQLAERGVKTTAVTDRQYDACLAGGLDRSLSARAIERDRLFDQNVFSRRRRSPNLLRVLTMRRGEYHGVDIGIGQDCIEIVHQTDALGAAEIFHLGACAGMADDKANIIAVVLHRGHERASPTAQSNNGCANHGCLILQAGFTARKC